MKTNINIEIELDENRVPEKLHWSAKDGGVEKEETKAVFLSVWDDKNKEALRVDLWTKEMPLDEMKVFSYQLIKTMSDTMFRATSEQKLADSLKKYAEEFADVAGLKEG